MKKHLRYIFAIAVLALSGLPAAVHAQQDKLLSRFQQPPDAARPRVWWHWMNGNITTEGIRKDLLWMNRSGIRGFQTFDAAFETPQVVKDRLLYMSPPWKRAFRYALRLGDSLGMEMAIASSPGWSETGGSWVPVADGMKKLVWTEARLRAGQRNVRLVSPPASAGLYQNMPLLHDFGEEVKLPTLYHDVAVIAFPVQDIPLQDFKPQITSNAGHFTLARLTDNDLSKADTLPGDPASGKSWICYTFQKPQTVRAVTIMGGGDKGFLERNGDLEEARALEVSDDGLSYRHIAFLPAGETLQMTYSIPAVTGRFFRVVFRNLPGNPGTPVSQLVLHGGTRVEHAEDKAGFAPAQKLLYFRTTDNRDGIPSKKIVDLTGKMRADGTLDWTAPAGNWCVLRLGYTVMGKTNHPATREATGFEVDKMDKAAIARYFGHYLAMYRNASAGDLGKKGIRYMLNDSWEPGAQNWTPKMLTEFERRRGYSMIPWLPVLTGYVVRDAAASDKFLYDFRRTIGEMTVEYHYDQLTDILKKAGMERYSESHELRRALIADGMAIKRRAAIPMSAIWTKNPIINKNDQTGYIADIRESASVAHIYGQNIVAAESLTALAYPNSAWAYCPENLKPTADLALASGLNRFVIHCSPHQPVDSLRPGLGLGPFGQWFTRQETWAEQARAWTDYLSRSSYLLQQGKFVADIAYYYGEDDNISSIFRAKQPPIPKGYNFDYVNTDILLHLLSVRNGRLVTPSGMSYKVLVLDSNARVIPLAVLRKIKALYEAGAMIAGVRPERPAGLRDDAAAFNAIVAKVWDSRKTRVAEGFQIERALKTAGVAPDFQYPEQQGDLLYVHRRLPGRDIFWVNNREAMPKTIEASFRLTGRLPELWQPETGKIRPLSYRMAGGRTTVTLPLTGNDAVFVIFKTKTAKKTLVLPLRKEVIIRTLDGPWRITFQKGRGAPAGLIMDSLMSFTKSADPGIKYFSGSAIYHKKFLLERANDNCWLDLGSVKNIAEVRLNGQLLGTLWKAPFKLEIGRFTHAGENDLEIKVVNLWVNRLIGDRQPGAKKIGWTTQDFYQADAPLLPSGLLGPVRILKSE